jgi:MFS family permease
MVQNATANTLVQSIVPDEIRGRVMSVYMLVFFGSMPFGSLQMGALAQVLGPSVGIAIGAAVALAFAVFTLLAVPKVRQLEI